MATSIFLPQWGMGMQEATIIKWLKKEARGFLSSTIKWNFTKFLIDAEGKVLKRFAPTTTPQAIETYITGALR